MFHYNDLYNYYNPADKTLSSEQIDRITAQADHDLAERALFGIYVLPSIYLISAILTPFAKDVPGIFLALGFLIISASIVRFISSSRIRKKACQNRLPMQQAYMLSSIASGLGWGLFSATSLYLYASQPPNIYVLYFLAAVAGGAVASFSTWQRLNQIYLILLLTPAIITPFIIWDKGIQLVGILAFIYLIYNFALIRKWNASYWHSLINVYLLENEVAERREAEEEAARANKLKTEFLDNMSHEMRTPLHSILSYAKFGQNRAQTIPRQKLEDYFSTITSSGNRLLILVNDLLDLAKLESGKIHYEFEECEITNTLSQVISEMKGLADEKQVEIQQASMTPMTISFDQSKISQVIYNLLSNAIKFSHKDSVISVECKQIIEDNKDYLLVAVQDKGIGIPAGEENQIFDKFIQSSKTQTGAGGTGLGLSISNKIIQDHGGRIWAANNADHGTTFFFTLPVNGSQGK